MKKIFIVMIVGMLMLSGCQNTADNSEIPDETISDTPKNSETDTTEPELTQKHEIETETEIERDISESSELDAEMIKQAEEFAKEYYKSTVFEVVSIELKEQSGNEVVFAVCASKDGVVQEPNRTIWLQFNNEKWEVTNEGF